MAKRENFNAAISLVSKDRPESVVDAMMQQFERVKANEVGRSGLAVIFAYWTNLPPDLSNEWTQLLSKHGRYFWDSIETIGQANNDPDWTLEKQLILCQYVPPMLDAFTLTDSEIAKLAAELYSKDEARKMDAAVALANHAPKLPALIAVLKESTYFESQRKGFGGKNYVKAVIAIGANADIQAAILERFESLPAWTRAHRFLVILGEVGTAEAIPVLDSYLETLKKHLPDENDLVKLARETIKARESHKDYIDVPSQQRR